MMTPRVLALFTIAILFGLQGVFLVFQNGYSGNKELAFEVDQLKSQIEKEKNQTEVAHYELDSYKQKVALILPKNIPQNGYQTRNIASLVQESNSSVVGLPLDLEFRKIKKEFLQKNYEKAAQDLSIFINTYPESAHVLEAYYLYINCLYKLSQFERCIKAIDVLVDQYPESEMTGLSLMIMADIFSKQERYDEAKEIYKTIIHNFQYPQLQERAKAAYSEINI